jgi:hypothetical protein
LRSTPIRWCVTNLAKYWYCNENGLINKSVYLLHLFRKNSKNDYESHLILWDFLYGQMKSELKDKIEAIRHTYYGAGDLILALVEFERLIKENFILNNCLIII